MIWVSTTHHWDANKRHLERLEERPQKCSDTMLMMQNFDQAKSPEHPKEIQIDTIVIIPSLQIFPISLQFDKKTKLDIPDCTGVLHPTDSQAQQWSQTHSRFHGNSTEMTRERVSNAQESKNYLKLLCCLWRESEEFQNALNGVDKHERHVDVFQYGCICLWFPMILQVDDIPTVQNQTMLVVETYLHAH